MLTINELENLEKGVYFKKENLLGKGLGGKVYKINDELVVKKFPSYFKCFDFLTVSYYHEMNVNIMLSSYNISPKIFYHSKKQSKYNFFVMEKLDYTLKYMLEIQMFGVYHLDKLEKLIKKLNKTKYRHNDFHFQNIMWSEKQSDFRIIDWGECYITKNPEKHEQLPEIIDFIKSQYINNIWDKNKQKSNFQLILNRFFKI